MKISAMFKLSYPSLSSTSISKQKVIVASLLLIIIVVSAAVSAYVVSDGFNLQGVNTNPSPTASFLHTSTPIPTSIQTTTPASTPTPTSTNLSIPTPTPTLSAAIGGGEEKILRNVNTADEKRALAAAENLNSTEVFNIAPLTLHGYAYANFIDSEVINYYHSTYENAKGITHFSYTANVHTWNQTHAVYVTGRSISVSSPNGTILFPLKEGWGIQIRYAYLNSTRYQEISADKIDFSFSNCYVVEMRVGFSQSFGPTAGYMSEVYQIVIVNEDFKPVLLCAQSQQAVS